MLVLVLINYFLISLFFYFYFYFYFFFFFGFLLVYGSVCGLKHWSAVVRVATRETVSTIVVLLRIIPL